MSAMKPGDMLMRWNRERAIDRVIGCRVMLAAHGFLSDAEKRKVDQRIDKWARANGYALKGRQP